MTVLRHLKLVLTKLYVIRPHAETISVQYVCAVQVENLKVLLEVEVSFTSQESSCAHRHRKLAQTGLAHTAIDLTLSGTTLDDADTVSQVRCAEIRLQCHNVILTALKMWRC